MKQKGVQHFTFARSILKIMEVWCKACRSVQSIKLKWWKPPMTLNRTLFVIKKKKHSNSTSQNVLPYPLQSSAKSLQNPPEMMFRAFPSYILKKNMTFMSGWWFQPVWKTWKSIENWDDSSQYMEKIIQSCSSHHQPDVFPGSSHRFLWLFTMAFRRVSATMAWIKGGLSRVGFRWPCRDQDWGWLVYHGKMVVEWDFMGLPSGNDCHSYGKSLLLIGEIHYFNGHFP